MIPKANHRRYMDNITLGGHPLEYCSILNFGVLPIEPPKIKMHQNNDYQFFTISGSLLFEYDNSSFMYPSLYSGVTSELANRLYKSRVFMLEWTISYQPREMCTIAIYKRKFITLLGGCDQMCNQFE